MRTKIGPIYLIVGMVADQSGFVSQFYRNSFGFSNRNVSLLLGRLADNWTRGYDRVRNFY